MRYPNPKDLSHPHCLPHQPQQTSAVTTLKCLPLEPGNKSRQQQPHTKGLYDGCCGVKERGEASREDDSFLPNWTEKWRLIWSFYSIEEDPYLQNVLMAAIKE